VFIADVITCLHHGSCRRSRSLFRCTFVEVVMILCVGWHCDSTCCYCGSQLFIADVIARLHGSCCRSLFSCSLVEWSKSARLHGSRRQSLFSSSLVEAGRLVYMALVVRVTLVQLCFGGSGTASHLWQYVKSHASLWLMTLR